ncbi:hypothetical protein [Sphingomonas paucimobilis]|uniref:Uncharacterized protein n=1 Tax=Sphingomonas paucimobilis TaxID=13689 RepID=A0A7T3E7Z1_SPHPI|nr:hypothetical protein [Sphingomonas paucimobilis]QPT09876.1 hypothetical protein I6G38_06445 [Sphingomonas paucimobilis]
MKKDSADQPQDTSPEASTVTPASDDTALQATPADAVDEPAAPAFDPAVEWPATGGTYVRQADGTLTKEG